MTTTEHGTGEPRVSRPDPDDLAVRPRLGHDVLFADTGYGVVLRNAEKAYVIKGRTAYRLTASLAPLLTGEFTVGELCARLPPERRGVVVDFVRSLVERGFARNAGRPSDVDLAEPVRRLFAPQLAYVEHYADGAPERFLRFRTARVLLLGTGRVNRAAAAGLLRNGLAALDFATSTADADAVAAGLADTVAELAAAGCPPRVTPVQRTADEVPTSPDLAGYDFVVAAGDDIGPAALRRLADLAVAGGPAVLPATTIGSKVLIGPVSRPATAGCWTCAALRYAANAEPGDAAALWYGVARPGADPGATPLAPQLAAMVGNVLAYDLFRLTTGCLDAETDRGVLVQDTATLETRRERLWPHPLCTSCGDHQDATATPVTPALLTDPVPPAPGHTPIARAELEELLADLDELVGAHTGVLSAFEDAEPDQTPLKVSRVRLGDPARLITAFDLHFVPVARRAALRAALLVYVGRIASLRGAAVGTVAPADTVAPAGLSTWTGLSAGEPEPCPWLPATSVVDGRGRLVPAAAVHPFSRLNADSEFEHSGAGGGAGATLGEAVRAGLLSALAFEALRDAASGRGVGRPVACADPETGSELEFLLRTVANLDLEVELVELSPWRNADVVLARTAGDAPLWVVRAALSRPDAVIAALRDLVGSVQVLRGPDAAAADLGEPLMPGLDARVVRAAGDPVPDAAGSAPGTAAALVGELAEAGRDVLVVDTTTPELRSRGGVATARVLLTRCPS